MTTNVSGQAVFIDLPAGTRVFTASKTGYASNNAIVTIVKNISTSATIILQSSASTGNLTVRVSELVPISEGSFIFEWRNVNGATVTVTGSVTRMLTTGADGIAKFTSLPAGSYQVNAGSYGSDTAIVENGSETVVSIGEGLT